MFGVFLPPANEVWGKVIFSVVCVKNSVHRGGLPQCMLRYHPQDQASPSWEQTPPRADPLGEDTPPSAVHAGRYGQQAGSMHPTGMQSLLPTNEVWGKVIFTPANKVWGKVIFSEVCVKNFVHGGHV